MHKLIAALVSFSVITSAIFLPSCDLNERRSQLRLVKKSVKIYHLADGRTCYKDPITDIWYWLSIPDVDGGKPTFYISDKSINANTEFPSGVIWSLMTEGKKAIEPETKQLEEVEKYSFDYEVLTDELGNPANSDQTDDTHENS